MSTGGQCAERVSSYRLDRACRELPLRLAVELGEVAVASFFLVGLVSIVAVGTASKLSAEYGGEEREMAEERWEIVGEHLLRNRQRRKSKYTDQEGDLRIVNRCSAEMRRTLDPVRGNDIGRRERGAARSSQTRPQIGARSDGAP